MYVERRPRSRRRQAEPSAKVRDWLAGRDRHSDTSLAAYQRVAADIVDALPEEFAPTPVTEEMIGWFWRHNTWRGTYTEPLPPSRTEINEHRFPAALFDDGDQHHRPRRWLPSWNKTLRVASPDGHHPDSYQAILPVTHTPRQGIAFPGSEFLEQHRQLPWSIMPWTPSGESTDW